MNADTHTLDELLLAFKTLQGPVYQRLKQAISQLVKQGQWPAEMLIPSEMQLVAAMGVSRMTVNRAMRELTVEGVLQRQQGVGTFVAARKPLQLGLAVEDIADQVTQSGAEHSLQVLRQTQAGATSDEAKQMGVAVGSPLFRGVFVHFADGKPVQLEERLLNVALAPEFSQQDFTQITPYQFMRQQHAIERVEKWVEAVLPQRWEGQLFGLAENKPCLQMHRTVWMGEQILSQVRLLTPDLILQLEGVR